MNGRALHRLRLIINLHHLPNGHTTARHICLASGKRIAEGNAWEFAFERLFNHVTRHQVAFRGSGGTRLLYHQPLKPQRHAAGNICCTHKESIVHTVHIVKPRYFPASLFSSPSPLSHSRLQVLSLTPRVLPAFSPMAIEPAGSGRFQRLSIVETQADHRVALFHFLKK